MRLAESCYRISKVIQFRILRPDLGYYIRPFGVPEKEMIQDWIGSLGMRERQNNQEQYRLEFFSTSLFQRFDCSNVQKRSRIEERHFYFTHLLFVSRIHGIWLK